MDPDSRSVQSTVESVGDRDSRVYKEAKIVVAVRVRPLLQKEKEAGHEKIIRVMSKRLVLLLDPKRFMDTHGLTRRTKEKRYVFDHAFSDEASQGKLYSVTTSFLVDNVLDGFNATVFAYGATGSGKTYTMTGTPEHPGIMFLTLKDLFHKANLSMDRGVYYKIVLTYLEIYNENIRDLMKIASPYLDLREHPTKGMQVNSITEFEVQNVEEIMQLLQAGNENRTTEPTEANLQSSRSHAVLQVMLEQHDATLAQVKTAKLNLIDLAGSERGAVTQNRGIRLVEGANINRSLLALGNCINALSGKTEATFVPYRDSKLTRLLKDSLGGNCNTVMITTVSPSHTSFEESINTLKYASRAKKIKNYVTSNEKTVKYHVSRYEKLITDLQQQVVMLKAQLELKSGMVVGVNTSLEGYMKEADNVRAEMIEVFERRLNIRRQLVDLQKLELSKYLAASVAKSTIDEYKARGLEPPEGMTPRAPSPSAAERNSALRDILTSKLKAAENSSLSLKEKIIEMRNKTQKELLLKEFEFKNLEIDYLMSESAREMQRQLSENKDAQLKRLKLHVRLRDAVISQQKDTISSNGDTPMPLQMSYSILSKQDDGSSLPALHTHSHRNEAAVETARGREKERDTNLPQLVGPNRGRGSPRDKLVSRDVRKRATSHRLPVKLPNIRSPPENKKPDPLQGLNARRRLRVHQ